MNMDYDKITQIRKSVNIVDIIGEYIPLEQRGRNYFAVCPFHDDHNPSMSISPEKQIYTCFVCGAHGNVFNFIMDYEGVSFYDALKRIADKVGILIDTPKKASTKPTKESSIYDIYDIANKFYQNNLYTKEGKEALEYLRNRNFDDDIIKTFGVGLSVKSLLTDVLKKKKFSEDVLLNSGISTSTDGKVHDTFINRIMFPLCDLDGKVVGFSGRIYNSESPSKYVNSKESDIFKKGYLLYNYHRAKEECRKEKSVIVVEGFMDVIALYMVGIYNVVATMGTAITKEQAKLLKRLSLNIILCFDGDAAGNKATSACAKELNEIGVYPKVIRLPDNLDPDEFLKKYGVDKFREYLDNPKSTLDYKIDEYKKDTNFSDSESISKYIKNVVLELQSINDPIIREITINKLSNETNISIPTINGMLKKNRVVKKEKENKSVVYNKYEKAEMRLIFYMTRHSEVMRIYKKNKCYFPDQNYRYLVNEVVHYYDKHDNINIADFITYLSDKEELLNVFNKIDVMDIPDEYSYDEIMDYINLLNDYSVKEQIRKLSEKFKTETDEIKKLEIANEIQELKVRV